MRGNVNAHTYLLTLSCITLHDITFALHCFIYVTLHYTKFHSIALHELYKVALNYMACALQYVNLHVHSVTLHLHCVTLHHVALH